MEFAIRRAIELGYVPHNAFPKLSATEFANNAEIIRRIWAGQERFADIVEPPALTAFIGAAAPRLFKLYEKLLNRASRHRNLELARRDPAAWRVPGALEFMHHLRDAGCRNYFVTGAVVSDGGMADDVAAVGYPVGRACWSRT